MDLDIGRMVLGAGMVIVLIIVVGLLWPYMHELMDVMLRMSKGRVLKM